MQWKRYEITCDVLKFYAVAVCLQRQRCAQEWKENIWRDAKHVFPQYDSLGPRIIGVYVPSLRRRLKIPVKSSQISNHRAPLRSIAASPSTIAASQRRHPHSLPTALGLLNLSASDLAIGETSEAPRRKLPTGIDSSCLLRTCHGIALSKYERHTRRLDAASGGARKRRQLHHRQEHTAGEPDAALCAAGAAGSGSVLQERTGEMR